MKTIWLCLILGATLALFFPVYGPVLDHHFGERLLDHSHLYFKEVAPEHVHPYQVPHTHLQPPHGLAASAGNISPTDRPSSYMVCLTSFDGMGPGLAKFPVPYEVLAVVFPNTEDIGFGFPIAEDCFLQSAFIAPPKKPPRL